MPQRLFRLVLKSAMGHELVVVEPEIEGQRVSKFFVRTQNTFSYLLKNAFDGHFSPGSTKVSRLARMESNLYFNLLNILLTPNFLSFFRCFH